jgi:hypothetical protein
MYPPTNKYVNSKKIKSDCTHTCKTVVDWSDESLSLTDSKTQGNSLNTKA